MKKEYTPGPWRIVDNESIKDSDNNLITVLICDLSFSLNTTMANITLLAAAPELLEACIVARAQLLKDGITYENADQYNILNDAIKKATELKIINQ